MAAEINGKTLETTLEMFIENIRQVNIMVADFQPQAQTVLNQKIQRVVTDLQEIDKFKSQVQDVQIPMEVFEYIDKGKNPQMYTKERMNKAVAKNEEIKGKIDGYKRFKAHLMLQVNEQFPKQLAKYRAIREYD